MQMVQKKTPKRKQTDVWKQACLYKEGKTGRRGRLDEK